jgi:branched-chain amino acid transport system ATP-binding protein
LLVLENVRAEYGRIVALQGISLAVNRGEFVSVIGPNGAGKSTMLAAITGIMTPTAGTISLEGEKLSGQAPEKIVRQGVALVPEGRRIFTTLTVEENLLLGATPRGRLDNVEADLSEVFDLFPILKDRFKSSAAKLSGGEQQQLAIARALLSRPKLLLLDEPSLGLAPFIIDVMFNILQQLRAAGNTILLVEQNAAMAVEAADRSYVLRRGKIELSGTREELLATEDFERAFLGFGEKVSVA